MYYDLLVRIKNAQAARKKMFRMPFLNMDFAIAKILADYNLIRDARKKVVDKKSFLEVELVPRDSERRLRDFKIVSKPGRRIYIGYKGLRPVKQGYGLGILSTPQGIRTNIDAKKNRVGGEYLFEVW